jgi:hypothetical protein
MLTFSGSVEERREEKKINKEKRGGKRRQKEEKSREEKRGEKTRNKERG